MSLNPSAGGWRPVGIVNSESMSFLSLLRAQSRARTKSTTIAYVFRRRSQKISHARERSAGLFIGPNPETISWLDLPALAHALRVRRRLNGVKMNGVKKTLLHCRYSGSLKGTRLDLPTSSRSSSPERLDVICDKNSNKTARLRLNGIIMDAVQRRELWLPPTAQLLVYGAEAARTAPTHGRPTTAHCTKSQVI